MRTDNQKEDICVFFASQAKALVREGFRIVDLKMDRCDPDKKRTIFVFKNENGISRRICELRKKELSQKRGQTVDERNYTRGNKAEDMDIRYCKG